jgi:glycosyltransferase 2 family protein
MPESSDVHVAIGGDRGVQATAGRFRRGIRIFASPVTQPRFRRATDILMLVPALLGTAFLIVAYPPSAFERSLATFLASVPAWLDPVWGFLYDLLGLWAIALVIAAVAARRRTVVIEAVAAFVVASLCAIASTRLAIGDWPALGSVLPGSSDSPVFPAVPVAEGVAVILTVAPNLTRPLQTAGRWVVVLGVLGALLTGTATPSGTVAGFLVAIAAAAGVRLALGTSAGRPGLASVAGALRELGVIADALAVADRQTAGVFIVQGEDSSGRQLVVKVYGRDAYDTQVIAKLWRTVWYQDSGAPLRLGRAQAAEHEAFVTLLARNGGVPTREVVTAGETVAGDALLVLRGSARSIEDVAASELDETSLRSAWHTLALLGRANIAHLQIDPTSVAIVGDDVALIDFAGATVSPSTDQLQTDRVQLLVTSATVAGADRAVAAAVESLGTDGVAGLLPYFQSAALRTPLRKAVKSAGIDMDDLRKSIAIAVDAEVPDLIKLRRVTWWTVIQITLLVLAAAAIISAASSVDWEALRADLADAGWGWIAFGFVVAQLPRLAQAASTLGSIAASLPFGPVYMKELATSYLNLAMPSNLGRMAVSIRFFQRQGLPGVAAVAAGAIDSIANTVVQATLLVVLLLFSEASLSLQLNTPDAGSLRLLWILVGLFAAVVLVAVVVGRIRRAIVERVRAWWPQFRISLEALRAPHKLALLLGGNIAGEVLFASALGLFARGLGAHITLTTLLVINMSVSLLASFIPVPGGVGVVEFGLTLGLTSAGMAEEPALAAVLLYRLSTFYLPPLWGFFAMRWLQRNRYL